MSDQGLIEQALSGSQRAFKELYEQHVDMVFRFLTQFNADRDRVADWTQQAFIKAFQALHRFQGRSKFSTWLMQIAINEMKMDLRSLKETEMLETSTVDAQHHNEMEIEDYSGVRTVINRLDERYRAVFLLYEVEGYSHQEIAEILNVGVSTSRTMLTRAKTQLRNMLAE